MTAPPIRPTKKQRQLLSFIEQFIAQHNYSPSYREIMRGLNYTSVATVALHVNNLIQRGHLRKRDHSARSLEVVVPSLPGGRQAEAADQQAERWLRAKVEAFFAEAEQPGAVTPERVDQLYVLVSSLRLLGFEAAAKELIPRLGALHKQVAPRPDITPPPGGTHPTR